MGTSDEAIAKNWGARAKAAFPLGLGTDVWGGLKKWVLLRDDALDLTDG